MKSDHNRTKVLRLCRAAMFASLYVVLTEVSFVFGLASNPIQIRIAEALCVLPVFFPEAIGGVTVGCFIADILTGCIPTDVIAGTFATFIGLAGAYFIGKLVRRGTKFKKFAMILVPIPNLVANSVILPFVMKFGYGFEEGVWYFVATIAAGEIISAWLIGTLLLFALEKYRLPGTSGRRE